MLVELIDALGAFFRENWPAPDEAVIIGVPSFAGGLSLLAACSWLRRGAGWQVGYTRKLFHFVIFFTAAGVQVFRGTPALCVFGGAVSLVLLGALLAGTRGFLLAALARPSDAPHEAHFIVVPYLATVCGGILANALVGHAAVFGYLVTGLADAVAEPVGVRWGRHRYRVPSRRGVPATRSVEGSLAVFLAAAIASTIALVILEVDAAGSLGAGGLLLRVALLAAASTLLEAISPHGWDNLTVQLGVSLLAYGLFQPVA